MVPGTMDAGAIRRAGSEWIVVISALSLFLSSVGEARLEVGRAHVHPYLFVLVPMGWKAVREVLENRPLPVRRASLFFFLFVVSMLPAGLNVAAALKLGASLFTLFAVAGMLKTQRGHGRALLALAVSGALLSIKGIFFGSGEGYGINPFEEVGNKNNFSVYAIPAAYAAGIVLLGSREGRWHRVLAAASFGLILTATFQTANRSGWLGVALCPVILAAIRIRRVRGMVLICATLAALYGLFRIGRDAPADDVSVLFGRATVFSERAEQTLEGYASDDLRRDLFVTCLELGLTNPIYGTSFNALSEELGRRLSFPGGMVGPHNVLGLLIGGCGLFVTASFLALGRLLWQGAQTERNPSAAAPESVLLLRGILFLWLLRGMFSDEVLYAPAFAIAIGILVANVWTPGAKARLAQPAPDLLRTTARRRPTDASRRDEAGRAGV